MSGEAILCVIGGCTNQRRHGCVMCHKHWMRVPWTMRDRIEGAWSRVAFPRLEAEARLQAIKEWTRLVIDAAIAVLEMETANDNPAEAVAG
jgi:hypothetical protein